MSISSEKSTLPVKLSQISQKRSLLFFRKLVLLEEPARSQKSVRHYDYQCEGISLLIDFFKKKQQMILVKGFNLIKDASRSVKKCLISTDRQKYGKDTTRRCYLNSTFSPSEASPIRLTELDTQRGLAKNEQDQFMYLSHSKTERNSNTLNDLLKMVKNVNRTSKVNRTYDGRHYKTQKTENDSNRQNTLYYGKETKNTHSNYISKNYQTQSRCAEENANYYNYYKSQALSTKNSRRRFILEKINRIEGSLYNIGNDEVTQHDLSEQIIDQIRNLRQQLNTYGKRQYPKS